MTDPMPDAKTALQRLKSERLLPGPGLHNLYVLQGSLTTVSGLHIGQGDSPVPPPADRKGKDEHHNTRRVILEAPRAGVAGGLDPSRDAKGQPLPGCFPYIPATSLRGVLRGWCEQMLGPHGPDFASRDGPDSLRAPRERAPDEERDVGDAREALRLRDGLDLVSGIFGGTRWRSKLEVGPGRIARGGEVPDKRRKSGPSGYLICVPRVAIDPHLGSAEDGKLFKTELVRPGTRFEVRLRLQNVRPWELGLLVLALDSFNDPWFPTRLGANTQQGLGQLRWKLEGVECLGAEPGEDVLDSWIRARQARREGKPLPKPTEDFERWIGAFEQVWRDLIGAVPPPAEG